MRKIGERPQNRATAPTHPKAPAAGKKPATGAFGGKETNPWLENTIEVDG